MYNGKSPLGEDGALETKVEGVRRQVSPLRRQMEAQGSALCRRKYFHAVSLASFLALALNQRQPFLYLASPTDKNPLHFTTQYTCAHTSICTQEHTVQIETSPNCQNDIFPYHKGGPPI